MEKARPICRALERQEAARAFSRAWAKTGKRIAARMAIIAITTRSSIRVKPRRIRRVTMGSLLSIPQRPSARNGRAKRAEHGSSQPAAHIAQHEQEALPVSAPALRLFVPPLRPDLLPGFVSYMPVHRFAGRVVSDTS